MGLPYASYWLLTDNSYDLNCMYLNDVLAYHNPSPAYAFCTAPLPPSECEPIISSTDDDVEKLSVSLFPNPTTGIVYIDSEKPVSSIVIYNAQGVIVNRVYDSNEIDIDHLPVGVYFALIKNQRGITVEKVIKQ